MIGLPDLFFRVKMYAKKNKSILIHDSVEWYSPEEYKNGKFSIEYNLKNITNKYIIKKPWKVIAISKYLEDYYLSKKIETLRIPVIFDVQNINPIYKSKGKKCIFLYAGSPGKKDYLNTIINGFSIIPESYNDKYEFHIFGVNKEQLIKDCDVNEQKIILLKNNLFIHGRVNRDTVIDNIKKANYTVLIRDNLLRYAKAGFPTKVVESLTYCTPVVCNLSSDLGDYLKDGDNCILLKQITANDFCKAVIEGINKNEKEQKKMQENARKTADIYFDYRAYGKQICKLLKD